MRQAAPCPLQIRLFLRFSGSFLVGALIIAVSSVDSGVLLWRVKNKRGASANEEIDGKRRHWGGCLRCLTQVLDFFSPAYDMKRNGEMLGGLSSV